MLAGRSAWRPCLGLAVAAVDVAGLAAGVHRYAPAAGGFVPVGGEAVLRGLPDYAPAPALVFVSGDLDRAQSVGTDLTPPDGYQRLLVRAGALGHAVLLAAMASGLRGCLFGAASTRISVLLHTGTDDRPHHLFTVALGWPTDPDNTG